MFGLLLVANRLVKISWLFHVFRSVQAEMTLSTVLQLGNVIFNENGVIQSRGRGVSTWI